MKKTDETIFALSTAQGKSALAVIRVSGPSSYKNIKKISTNMPKKPNISSYNEIKLKDGTLIDQTITTFYKAHKSYTGEDMVEISTHGSNAVIRKLIQTLTNFADFRIAFPGEFTRRAFENNKLDLTQVEAISDIVNAETEMQRKQAMNHLSGHFFKSTKKIFDQLKKILANIEAIIDFSEEDLPQNLLSEIKEQIKNIIIKIKKIISGAHIGISIREGFFITVLGKPNTGKSSFINRISGKDVAIVTNKPGTTRDLLESFLDISGYPIKFIDTAGIRKSKNIVENLGVEKALKASLNADVNIVFIDNIRDIKDFKKTKNAIFVKSKQDINKSKFVDRGYYNISSKNGYGIKNLLDLIIINISNKSPKENSYISRERHLECLKKTLYYLEKSKQKKSVDLFAEDMRVATKNLSNLFGSVDIEDILDIIFTDFCIGK